MTTLKQLKPALNFIKKNSRPLLTNVLVDQDGIKLTDLETSILIKDNFDLDHGLHQYETLGLLDGNKDQDNEFPTSIFSIIENDHFNLSIALIESLIPFASKDETRLHLNGMAIDNGHYVCCDGHTLKTHELSNNVNGSYIIPATSLKILVKLLKKFKIKSDFKCIINNSFLVIDNEYFTLSSRLIQRDVVPWTNVVPTKYASKIEVTNWIDFKELKPLFNKRSMGCKIELKNGDITLTIPGYENNKYIIGSCDSKLDFEIGYNASFIDRAVGKLKSFTIDYNNELSPTSVNGAIVMPLRV